MARATKGRISCLDVAVQESTQLRSAYYGMLLYIIW
eukprot:COSAG06_NODE_1510_length_9237_cov_9.498140_8_plen_35_part_01